MIAHLLSIYWLSSFAFATAEGTITFSSGQEIKVEIAQSSEEKAKGLMYRTSLPKNTGMLFIFPTERILSFWMKNTYLPLTIAFFNKNKKLLELQDMEPHIGPVAEDKLKHYFSASPAIYALEMEQGWFAKNKIRLGETFELKIKK